MLALLWRSIGGKPLDDRLCSQFLTIVHRSRLEVMLHVASFASGTSNPEDSVVRIGQHAFAGCTSLSFLANLCVVCPVLSTASVCFGAWGVLECGFIQHGFVRGSETEHPTNLFRTHHLEEA